MAPLARLNWLVKSRATFSTNEYPQNKTNRDLIARAFLRLLPATLDFLRVMIDPSRCLRWLCLVRLITLSSVLRH